MHTLFVMYAGSNAAASLVWEGGSQSPGLQGSEYCGLSAEAAPNLPLRVSVPKSRVYSQNHSTIPSIQTLYTPYLGTLDP